MASAGAVERRRWRHCGTVLETAPFSWRSVARVPTPGRWPLSQAQLLSGRSAPSRLKHASRRCEAHHTEARQRLRRLRDEAPDLRSGLVVTGGARPGWYGSHDSAVLDHVRRSTPCGQRGAWARIIANRLDDPGSIVPCDGGSHRKRTCRCGSVPLACRCPFSRPKPSQGRPLRWPTCHLRTSVADSDAQAVPRRSPPAG